MMIESNGNFKPRYIYLEGFYIIYYLCDIRFLPKNFFR